jgi:hypothetical protein
MKERVKYDFARLDQYCKENNVVLLEDYSKIQLDGTVLIRGNCVYENCDSYFHKKFRQLINAGGYCKNCIKVVANENRKKFCLEKYGVENITKTDNYKDNVISTKYTYDFLKQHCENNNIFLCENYENEKIHCRYEIKGKCSNANCELFFNKPFCKLINSNSLCKNCSLQKAKEKRSQTNLETIGCENYFQNTEIKNKIKVTNLKKYGVEYVTQNKEIQNKRMNTCLVKYGGSHHSYDKNVQNKITQTNLKKYGVKHLMKKPEYLDKMLKKSFKFKDYTLPSGKIIKIQGYEHFALDELIANNKMDESDIITGITNVPLITYIDNNNIERDHHGDIYIPKENRIIEVKSTWTFQKPDVLLRQQAGKKLGYKYEIWKYDKKGNKTCYE